MNFDEYHKCPEPQPVDLDDEKLIHGIIEDEALRQYDLYYPYVDEETMNKSLVMMKVGIYNMLKKGAARIVGIKIEFWNPVEGKYQDYDKEYNRLMLDFMNDYKKRYGGIS